MLTPPKTYTCYPSHLQHPTCIVVLLVYDRVIWMPIGGTVKCLRKWTTLDCWRPRWYYYWPLLIDADIMLIVLMPIFPYVKLLTSELLLRVRWLERTFELIVYWTTCRPKCFAEAWTADWMCLYNRHTSVCGDRYERKGSSSARCEVVDHKYNNCTGKTWMGKLSEFIGILAANCCTAIYRFCCYPYKSKILIGLELLISFINTVTAWRSCQRWMMMRMMMSLTSHFLSNVTLSNSATGRTIEIDASDLVMKVGEQLIHWANWWWKW